MRKWLPIVGFLALAIGLLWIGQGTGVIAWPASSFMISQIQWAWYGAALAALGLILIWRGRVVEGGALAWLIAPAGTTSLPTMTLNTRQWKPGIKPGTTGKCP